MGMKPKLYRAENWLLVAIALAALALAILAWRLP